MYVVDTTVRISILALTPIQKWQAAKNLSSNNFLTERWIEQVCVTVIIVLTISLFAVSFRRIRRDRKISNDLFAEYAEERGLTTDERQILLEIIRKAGLRQRESIFSMVTAFDTGTAKIQKSLLGKQTVKENHQLEILLSTLREKLGFKKEASFSRGSPAKSERLSSRQIPAGKEVHVTRQDTQESDSIKATVIRNNDNELAVKMSKPVTIIFGEYWNVRYYFGSSFWEFDSFVISYDGNIMVLSHSDNVRFINRRRFVRAPVQKPAFVAHFPFERKLSRSIESVINKSETHHIFPEISLKPLQFVPAMVTELGGPGLRIETSIKVEVGDRVLILFELEREKERNLIKNQETNEATEVSTTTLRIVEDVGIVQEIGEVKRTEESPGRFTMAVELTGLRDSDIDCLIRATNAATLNKNEQITNAEDNSPVRIKV